jgi:hypothetical protein
LPVDLAVDRSDVDGNAAGKTLSKYATAALIAATIAVGNPSVEESEVRLREGTTSG